MTNTYYETIIIPLASGCIGVIITVIANGHFSKRKERFSYLREQIDKIYGPLFFGYLQKEILHKLCNESIELLKGNEALTGEKSTLYHSYKNDQIAHLRNFISLLQNMLKNNISFIDIEDIDKFQPGIKSLITICSYHDECEKKENDPNYAFATFSGDRLLELARESGHFLNIIKEKFYTKKNELTNFNKNIAIHYPSLVVQTISQLWRKLPVSLNYI